MSCERAAAGSAQLVYQADLFPPKRTWYYSQHLTGSNLVPPKNCFDFSLASSKISFRGKRSSQSQGSRQGIHCYPDKLVI